MIKILSYTILCVLVLHACAYVNPIQGARDSPDPGVVYDGQFYYAVTTGGWDGHHFPIWQSKDLFTWNQSSFIFMTKPSWAQSDFWAP